MMRRAQMVVALIAATSPACHKDRPATWVDRMPLAKAQQWGASCGEEDLRYQQAAEHGFISDSRSWTTKRGDGVTLSCHMEWDSGRKRVAELWVMVVAPTGYAVQHGDFAPGIALMEAAVPRRLASRVRALVPPAVGYDRIGDLEIESLPARRDARTGTTQWSIGIKHRAE